MLVTLKRWRPPCGKAGGRPSAASAAGPVTGPVTGLWTTTDFASGTQGRMARPR